MSLNCKHTYVPCGMKSLIVVNCLP